MSDDSGKLGGSEVSGEATPSPAEAPPVVPAPAPSPSPGRFRALVSAAPLAVLASGLIGGLVGGGVVAVAGALGDDGRHDRRHMVVEFKGQRPDRVFPRDGYGGPGWWDGGPGREHVFPRELPVPPGSPAQPAPAPSATPTS